MPAWLPALAGRWYALLPWALTAAVVWRTFGWRRALALLAGGYLITLLAEWASTAGWGVPFGVYHYRSSGLRHDLSLLGVPLFDSLSFTWLAFIGFVIVGRLGARGWLRIVLTALAMVAVDVVVDPVALRGAQWWLGSIYRYPPGSGVWYGVTLLNYVGWLVVGVVLALWVRLWLGDFAGEMRVAVGLSVALLAGVFLQSGVLAIVLAVGPSLLVALALLSLVGAAAVLGGSRRPATTLVIACALNSEAAAARSGLGGGWERDPGGGLLRWRSRRSGVEVWVTGAGPAAAAVAAARAPGSPILVTGLAGALDESWARGELGVGRRVLDPEGDWRALEPELTAALTRLPGIRRCDLATTSKVVEREADRRRLRARGAELVEMETAAWAAVPGLRVASLRVVLDRPGEPLGALAGLVSIGRRGPAPGRVAQLLLAHPGQIPQLIRLGRAQRQALARLAGVVAEAVQRMGSPGEPSEAAIDLQVSPP